MNDGGRENESLYGDGRGGSRGRVQGVRTLPPPLRDDLRLSNTTGILNKKKKSVTPFLTGASPSKKNPGSDPDGLLIDYDRGVARIFRSGGHTVSNIIVMAFSPRNIVGCLLKKGLQRGVTGTPGPPSLRPCTSSPSFPA